MTTDELLHEVSSRGLRVEVRQGVPRLVGPADMCTEKLLAVLRRHRAEVLRRHRESLGLREWLLPGGVVVEEWSEWSSVGDPSARPSTAIAVRRPGGQWEAYDGHRLPESVARKVPGAVPVHAQRGAAAAEPQSVQHLAGAVPGARRPDAEPVHLARAGGVPVREVLVQQGGLFERLDPPVGRADTL